MSWHHGDWLSFAQALASAFAIIGAFGVVLFQNNLEKQRRRAQEGLEAQRILHLAVYLSTDAKCWAADICELRSTNDSKESAAMRAGQRLRADEVIRELDAIQLVALPTSEATHYLMKVRRLMRQALLEVDRCRYPEAVMHGSESYGKPWIRFRNEFHEAATLFDWHARQSTEKKPKRTMLE